MNLFPHCGPPYPSGVQSSLCVYLYVYLCLCLGFCVTFWKSKSVARNCVHYMRPQATGSNPLRGSIIFLYVHPSTHPPVRPSTRSSGCPSGFPQTFCNFLYLYSIVLILQMITITINITSLGVQSCDAFIPSLGYGGPQWGQFKLIC